MNRWRNRTERETRVTFTHSRTVRIEWGDCDPAGIIFYPTYFRIFDNATAALFESALGMLPPSTVLAVYGIITEQDIGKLFFAGIVPGILAMLMYLCTIAIIGYVRPGFLPAGERASWREAIAGLKDIWAPMLLFVFVIGGLYGLPFLPRFTPTEAGGVGASGALLIGVLTGRLDKKKILAALLQATRTAAARRRAASSGARRR